MYIGCNDNGKRRYARGMNRVQSGVWSRDISRFEGCKMIYMLGRKIKVMLISELVEVTII